MSRRLASEVVATGLIRMAQSEGGFGVVVAKGDPEAGAIAVVLLERGANPRFLERTMQADGAYAWSESASPGLSQEDLSQRIERRRRIDPDLWVIELDIASAERFAAEMNLLR
jgi:hypothetical protein